MDFKREFFETCSMLELYKILKAVVNERYRRLEKGWKSIAIIPPDSKRVFIRLFGQTGIHDVAKYKRGKWLVVEHDYDTESDPNKMLTSEYFVELEKKYGENTNAVEWHYVEENSPWPLHANLAVHCIKEITEVGLGRAKNGKK